MFFVANIHVCLYWKHVLSNCVFLTIFPTIVDPFELSFSFLHPFPVFSAIEVLLYWSFRVCEKDFLFFFVVLFWDPLGATLSSWVLLRDSTKLANWELPKFNLVFYSCRLNLQLTTISDNLDFIKFHFFYNMGHIWFRDSHNLVHLFIQFIHTLGPFMTAGWPYSCF